MAPDVGDLKVLNALARSPGMFHSGFMGNSSTSIHSWVESVESVLLVFNGHELDRVPFSRLWPVLMVNMDDRAKCFVGGLTPRTWAEYKRPFVERFGRMVQQVQSQLLMMSMAAEEKVTAFLDCVERVCS